MKVKEFTQILIRPAANGVIVEPINLQHEARVVKDLYVFTTWEEFMDHLSELIEPIDG